MPGRNIGEVLRRHADELMALPDVAGVAEGKYRGKPCIIVFVVDRNLDMSKRIPATIEGYPLRVVESGEFSARASRRSAQV